MTEWIIKEHPDFFKDLFISSKVMSFGFLQWIDMAGHMKIT